MVTALEYRAMALQHHRWAGMCRLPQSREEHFRLEKELLALADGEERMHSGAGKQSADVKRWRCETRRDGGTCARLALGRNRGNRMSVLRLAHSQKTKPKEVSDG
jgi:hypothetical protein